MRIYCPNCCCKEFIQNCKCLEKSDKLIQFVCPSSNIWFIMSTAFHCGGVFAAKLGIVFNFWLLQLRTLPNWVCLQKGPLKCLQTISSNCGTWTKVNFSHFVRFFRPYIFCDSFLGKPSCKKSAFFLNIVQKAFRLNIMWWIFLKEF